MSNAEMEANLLTNSYYQAAITGEQTQKLSSEQSWNMFQLYQEIMYCEEQEDQLRVTQLLTFATKRGWTRTPLTPVTT